MKRTNSILIKAILLFVVIAVLLFAVKHSGISQYLAPDFAQEKVASFGLWAPVAFIGLFILVTVTFLPATPLDFVAGALFGTAAGVLYVVIGATIGATIAFVFTRTLGRGFVEKFVESRFQKLKKYDNKVEKHGLKVMLFLRLIPIFPFNGLNFAMGLTKIRFRDYVVGTAIGIIPGTFSYVYFGDSLASANLFNIFLAILFLIILSAIYPMYKKFRKLEKNEFDIIVIGAGSGGLNIAGFMNRAGFRTLLISKKEADIGGDCLNFGCIPSKAMIHIARTVAKARESRKFGIETVGKAEMSLVKKYIKEAQEKIRKHENADYFRKQGMEVAIGNAKFVSAAEVEVAGKKYRGRKIILATGSTPRKLEVPGAENVNIHSNETIFDLEELPGRLLIVGAGPIGIELGQAFASLGSKVVFVHRSERCLNKEDAEVSDVIFSQLEKQGVDFHFNSEIEEFASSSETVIKNKEGEKKAVSFGVVLASIGREIKLDGLDLQKAGIETKDGKLVLDKYLRTTNKNVLASGDVAGGYQFTHAAELHAKVILNNFFSPLRKKLSFDHFAWVTFSDPEVATFGLSEDELRKKGKGFNVLRKTFVDDDRAITDGYQDSLIKLIINKKGHILGGSIVAPGAGEIIQELILAMSSKIKVKDVFSKIYPYPVASRINKNVIGSMFAKKLESNSNRKLLRFLYH